mgnify:CR=1 FL=1
MNPKTKRKILLLVYSEEERIGALVNMPMINNALLPEINKAIRYILSYKSYLHCKRFNEKVNNSFLIVLYSGNRILMTVFPIALFSGTEQENSAYD